VAFIALRARVYAPKSVDATESTVLTPAAGAPHSDAFQIANVTGLAGYQPYLDRVIGRAGAIDPLTKSVDVGALTLVVGDIRTSASDTSRWLTAYCGDTSGRWQLPACKVVLEQATDWNGTSGTWTPYFTGRAEPAAADGLIRRGLRIKDLSTELDQPVFEGDPHPSITYAKRARLWPIGPSLAWGGVSAQAAIPVTLSDVVGDYGTLSIASSEAKPPRTITQLTRTLTVAPGVSLVTPDVSKPYPVRVFVAWTSGAGALNGTTCEYLLIESSPYYLDDIPAYFTGFTIHERQVAGADLLPSVSAVGSCWIEPLADSWPSKALPLFIDDVNPITLWIDLLAGKFGQINASSGVPDFPVAYDAAAFAALETTYAALITAGAATTLRFLIEARAPSLRAFIEEEICAPFHLTYRINAEGEVVPIDLRRPATTPSSIAIDDDDLLAVVDRASWEFGGQATGRVQGTYYLDNYVNDAQVSAASDFPDLSPSRVTVTEQTFTVVETSGRSLDLARKPLMVASRGLRVDLGEERASKLAAVHGVFDRLAAELLEPFGQGPAYVVLRCKRGNGAAAESATVGAWVSATSTALENPDTNTRGGARLVRVVEVSDEGDAATGLERRLRCLDPGPNPTAGLPSAPTATSITAESETTITVDFTMPATDVPATLRVEVDDGSGYTAWAFPAVTVAASATQTVVLTGLDPGTTYSVRAYGMNATGGLSTSASPTDSTTTDASTTIPTPTLGGSQVGSVVSLTITPGMSTPNGVTWVIERAGSYVADTMDATWEGLVPGGSAGWTVYGTKSGWTNSLDSNTVTLP
jgi:hypothetical protein